MSEINLLKYGLSITSVARIIQASLAFTSTVVLSLILSLREFGDYLVAIASISIFQYLFSHWFSTAVLRESKSCDDWRPISDRDIEVFVASLSALAVGLAGTYWLLADFFSLRTDLAFLAAIPAFIAESWFTALTNRASALGTWRSYIALYLLRGALTLALPLTAAFASHDAGCVLLAYGTGLILPCLFTRSQAQGGSWSNSIQRIRSAFYDYFSVSANSVLRHSVDRGDRIAVSLLFGSEIAGVYGLAADMTRRPLQILGGAVQAAFLPQISQAYHAANYVRFRNLWRLNGVLMVWLSVIGAFSAIIILDQIYFKWFPGKYPEYILAIAILLSVSAILELFDTFHVSLGLITIKKNHIVTYAYIIQIVLFVGALGLVSYFGNVLMTPAAVVLANFVTVGIVTVTAGKRIKIEISMSETSRAAAYYVFAMGGAFLCHLWMGRYEEIAIAIVIGTCGALLASFGTSRALKSLDN